MWYEVESGSVARPADVDTTSSRAYVFVRRNIAFVEEVKDGKEITTPAHYKWEEMKIPREMWGVYAANQLTETKCIELTAKLDAIMRYQGLNVRQTDAGVYEVIKDIPQTGDYLDPIPWRPGDRVKAGLWYYTDDKALPHEAIASGYPATFRDMAFFDFVD